jgi:hypothetical protein
MSSFYRILLERRRLNWLSSCRQLKRMSEVSFWLMRFYYERE